MLHKGRHGLERCLSTLLLHHETLGLLVTRHVASRADAQQLVFGSVLELVPLFGEVRTIPRIIDLDVKSGSVPRVLQLGWNGDTFLFDLFPDGLGRVIHSAGVDSLDFGFAAPLVSLETIGFGKRGIAALTNKASTVFVHVLDVTEVSLVQVDSQGSLAWLSRLDRISVGRWTSSTFPSSPKA